MSESRPRSGVPAIDRRRAVLDRRYRNALFVGLGVAAAVHLWVLVSNPRFETEPLQGASSIGVDVSLLTPSEVIVDGRPVTDGPAWLVTLSNYGEVKEALSRAWPRSYQRVGEGGIASLRLRLGSDGAVENVELVEGTDDRAKDEAFLALARQFRFSFHLDGRVPGRVEVVHPIRISPRD